MPAWAEVGLYNIMQVAGKSSGFARSGSECDPDCWWYKAGVKFDDAFLRSVCAQKVVGSRKAESDQCLCRTLYTSGWLRRNH